MSQWWMSLWAAPAALGFAIFFNVRRRTLLPIAALAISAHMMRAWLLSMGWDLVSASFVAAFLTGAIAYVIGPLSGEASPVFAFAPVIPLVPGTLMFDGLQGLAEATRASSSTQDLLGFTAAMSELVKAAGVVLALAFGATAPSLLRPKARRAD